MIESGLGTVECKVFINHALVLDGVQVLGSMFYVFRFSLIIKGRFLITKHVHELLFVSIFGYFNELKYIRVELF